MITTMTVVVCGEERREGLFLLLLVVYSCGVENDVRTSSSLFDVVILRVVWAP
jgi:hypothetical protein